MNRQAHLYAQRRKAAQLREGQQQQTVPFRLPLPLGGWNLRDAPQMMPKNDARLMDNIVPANGALRVVIIGNGFGDTDASAAMEIVTEGTITNLHAIDNASGGLAFLFTTDSGSVGRIQASGTCFTMPGTDNVRHQCMYSKVVGRNLYLAAISASATAVSWSGGASPTLTAVDMTSSGGAHDIGSKLNMIGPATYKNRGYWWKNRMKPQPGFWYSMDANGAIAGYLRYFDLSNITGGGVISITRWTVDGGAGPDDYFVILCDNGEVIVYQGIWPEDSDGWAIVGTYRIPQPLCANAVTEVGGKILVATEHDYVLLPDAFPSQGALVKESKIAPRVRELAANKALRSYWQSKFFPNEGWTVIKAPLSSLNSELHCFTREGAAFRITSASVACMTEVNGRLLYIKASPNPSVREINRRPLRTDYLGNPALRTRWEDFGMIDRKNVTAIRPQIWVSSSGDGAFPGVNYAVFADYDEIAASASVPGHHLATFVSGSAVSNAWLGAFAVGQHLSVHMRLPTGAAASINSEMEIRGIDVLGGKLGGIA